MPSVEGIAEGFQVLRRGTALGAEIRGIDLSKPINDATFTAIYEAFLAHLVIVFPGQTFSETDQIALSKRFGRLQVNVRRQYHHGAHPEIYVITNLDPEGRLIPEHPDPAATVWHTDGSYEKNRAIATMLYGIKAPKSGGDTIYSNMYLAYDALSDEMKRQLESLRAVHSLEDSLRRSGPQQIIAEEVQKAPPVEHPIIRVHPDTGRKCIYLGEHASYAVGMPRQEGEELVRKINEHATQPAFQYRHVWQPNDVVIWDNRCTLHKATSFDFGKEGRLIRRTTMIGEQAPHLAGDRRQDVA